MNVTVRILPDLDLLYVETTSVPEGIGDAWQRIEAPLTGILGGRKYFGLIRDESDGRRYRACMTRLGDDDARFGFETMRLETGGYVCSVVHDWPNNVPKIAELFQELERQFAVEPGRWNVEHYRSAVEVVLMVPVSDASAE